MGPGHEYVLDFTSLLLLFEFNLLHQDWIPKKKLLLPKLLYSAIDEYKKFLPIQHSFELQQAMTEGDIYHFSDNYEDNLRERFNALAKWINKNCKFVTNNAILQVDVPMQTASHQLLTYTMVELLKEDEANRILLTEDWYLEKLFNTNLDILSTETYMYEVEGIELGKLFSTFLTNNHNQHIDG